MWTSQARTSPRNSVCQSSSMISLRKKTWPGSARQGPQHLELGAGQVDRLAADGDEVGGQVDVDGARLDRRALSAVDAIEHASAKLGAHPAEQVGTEKGLVM
jgi:hypothetical protein